jgi:chemotaxis protein MotC
VSTRPVRITFAVSVLTMLLAGAALGQSTSGEPFELVRSLQSLQDQVTRGNARAHAYQRVLMGQIAEQFAGMNPERWKERKNVRAAVVFVLSGGNGSVLQMFVNSGVRADLDDKLIRGTLAYAGGHKQEAAKLLHSIDARSLDASIAGHVAYVQAELAAEKEPAKALAYLDDARLLAPGTLVEEAALRRQITLVADADGDRYQALATQYLRRFPHSVYAGSFKQQFAARMVAGTDASKPEHLAKLDAMLRALTPGERRDICLILAKDALDRGRVGVAKFAAMQATQLASSGSPEERRSRLLLAASLVATEELEKGVDMLAGIERAGLSDEDASIMDAALAVAGQVQRSVEQPGPTAVPPADIGERSEPAGRGTAKATAELIARAQKAVMEVDRMLSGAN